MVAARTVTTRPYADADACKFGDWVVMGVYDDGLSTITTSVCGYGVEIVEGKIVFLQDGFTGLR